MSVNLEPRCFSCAIPASCTTLHRHGAEWLCGWCQDLNGEILEGSASNAAKLLDAARMAEG